MTRYNRTQPVSTIALDQTSTTPSDDLPDFMPWVMLMQAIMEPDHAELSNAVLSPPSAGHIKKIALRIKKAKA